MSDDPILAAIAKLRTDFLAELGHMMAQINNQFERLLEQTAATRLDLENTKGHVVYVMEDSLALSRRITRLEEEMRRLRDQGGK
jgi:hypothetical protein